MSETVFTRQPHLSPMSDQQRVEILQDPGFGNVFTDHMVSIDWTWDEDGGAWHDARVEPYGPLSLDLSLIHISEPTRLSLVSRMPSSA